MFFVTLLLVLEHDFAQTTLCLQTTFCHHYSLSVIKLAKRFEFVVMDYNNSPFLIIIVTDKIFLPN